MSSANPLLYFAEYLSDGLKRLSRLSVCFTPQSPDQLSQVEEEAIRLSEEIKAEYWAVSAKSGGSHAHMNMNTNTSCFSFSV